MLSKTVQSISRSTTDMINAGVDVVRGLTLSEARDLFRFAYRRLGQEKLPEVAGSLTFTTVLSLVPLLTICFAIFTTFPMFEAFEVGLQKYFAQSLIPKGIASTILNHLTQFANKASRVSFFGAIALLITSGLTLHQIEQAFNQIWRVRRPRPLAQRALIYWALMTVGPLLIGLSVTVTSQLFMATSGLLARWPFIGTMFYTTLSVALTSGAFMLLYLTVPNRYVDWRDALWGGVVAGLCFEIAKRLFAVFIQQFPSYAVVYGALAALPLFLIWVYLCWMIALIGALLTASLPVVKYERWWYAPGPGDEFIDAVAILEVLYRQGRERKSALTSRVAIRYYTRVGFDEMLDLLEKMEQAGWVGRVQVEQPRKLGAWGKKIRYQAEHWVLLANPDQVRLADVYRMFVFQGDGPLARKVDAIVESGLDQSIGAYFNAAPTS
ncbi:YihY family inner membrane protein [Massilia sp. TS11]|uniref:YihY family inner membrane protein n=1 Tax=Massilia sp. TS11 TaxID=2908003 RepID=UPI001EDA0806|nr:YihY family inner membrane protein [Massilia sp. TS11]MCG2584621.1 YihY family inner membrane protein [Massilia sp. TS11]